MFYWSPREIEDFDSYVNKGKLVEKVELTKTNVGKFTELKKLMVISRDEGKILGKVLNIFINPEEKSLSGIVAKDEFWSRERFYFSMKDVETVGEDIILLNSEKSCQKIADESKLSGISLDKLQNHSVITDDGKNLGEFKDANFRAGTWEISEIFMDDNSFLKVEVAQIKIGEDEILVPATYALNIEKNVKDKKGLLSRLMGDEKSEDSVSDSKGKVH